MVRRRVSPRLRRAQRNRLANNEGSARRSQAVKFGFGRGVFCSASRSWQRRNADIPVGKFRGIPASWTARSGDLATCRLESRRYRQGRDAPRVLIGPAFLVLLFGKRGSTEPSDRAFGVRRLDDALDSIAMEGVAKWKAESSLRTPKSYFPMRPRRRRLVMKADDDDFS